MSFATILSASGVVLPEWIGEILFSDDLVKGAGHRYIRRIATGNPRRPWRYYYSVTGGKGIGHDDEFTVGSKFKVAHNGQAGHFEIVGKTPSGDLRIKHDETGHESTVSAAVLRDMLHKEHATAISAHREKLGAEIKAANGSAARDKLKAEAAKYSHTSDLAKDAEPKTPDTRPLAARHNAQAETTQSGHRDASVRHADLAEKAGKAGDEKGKHLHLAAQEAHAKAEQAHGAARSAAHGVESNDDYLRDKATTTRNKAKKATRTAEDATESADLHERDLKAEGPPSAKEALKAAAEPAKAPEETPAAFHRRKQAEHEAEAQKYPDLSPSEKAQSDAAFFHKRATELHESGHASKERWTEKANIATAQADQIGKDKASHVRPGSAEYFEAKAAEHAEAAKASYERAGATLAFKEHTAAHAAAKAAQADQSGENRQAYDRAAARAADPMKAHQADQLAKNASGGSRAKMAATTGAAPREALKAAAEPVKAPEETPAFQDKQVVLRVPGGQLNYEVGAKVLGDFAHGTNRDKGASIMHVPSGRIIHPNVPPVAAEGITRALQEHTDTFKTLEGDDPLTDAHKLAFAGALQGAGLKAAGDELQARVQKEKEAPRALTSEQHADQSMKHRALAAEAVQAGHQDLASLHETAATIHYEAHKAMNRGRSDAELQRKSAATASEKAMTADKDARDFLANRAETEAKGHRNAVELHKTAADVAFKAMREEQAAGGTGDAHRARSRAHGTAQARHEEAAAEHAKVAKSRALNSGKSLGASSAAREASRAAGDPVAPLAPREALKAAATAAQDAPITFKAPPSDASHTVESVEKQIRAIKHAPGGEKHTKELLADLEHVKTLQGEKRQQSLTFLAEQTERHTKREADAETQPPAEGTRQRGKLYAGDEVKTTVQFIRSTGQQRSNDEAVHKTGKIVAVFRDKSGHDLVRVQWPSGDIRTMAAGVLDLKNAASVRTDITKDGKTVGPMGETVDYSRPQPSPLDRPQRDAGGMTKVERAANDRAAAIKAQSAAQDAPAPPSVAPTDMDVLRSRIQAEKVHTQAAALYAAKEKEARGNGQRFLANNHRDAMEAHKAAAEAHKNGSPDAEWKTKVAERRGESGVSKADEHDKHAETHSTAAEALEDRAAPMGSGSAHMAHMDAAKAHKRVAEAYRTGEDTDGAVKAAHAASKRARDLESAAQTPREALKAAAGSVQDAPAPAPGMTRVEYHTAKANEHKAKSEAAPEESDAFYAHENAWGKHAVAAKMHGEQHKDRNAQSNAAEKASLHANRRTATQSPRDARKAAVGAVQDAPVVVKPAEKGTEFKIPVDPGTPRPAPVKPEGRPATKQEHHDAAMYHAAKLREAQSKNNGLLAQLHARAQDAHTDASSAKARPSHSQDAWAATEAARGPEDYSNPPKPSGTPTPAPKAPEPTHAPPLAAVAQDVEGVDPEHLEGNGSGAHTIGFEDLPSKTQSEFNAGMRGAETRKVREWLHTDNKTLRSEFEARTGVKLPGTLKATNEAIEQWHAGGRPMRPAPQYAPSSVRLAQQLKTAKTVRVNGLTTETPVFKSDPKALASGEAAKKLHTFTSTDKSRPNLHETVNVQDGKAYATDGHRLVSAPVKPGEAEGLHGSKTGTKLNSDLRFPDVSMVIPRRMAEDKSVIHAPALHAVANLLPKDAGRHVQASVLLHSKAGNVWATPLAHGEPTHPPVLVGKGHPNGGERIVQVNADYLRDSLKGHKGAANMSLPETYGKKVHTWNGPVHVEHENGENHYVMPMRIEQSPKHYSDPTKA